MAKVVFSGIGVTDMRAKVGSQVFTRGKSGQMVREWVIPTNTPSAARSNTRANFATANSLWSLVTESEFAQWSAFANRITLTTSVGKRYRPSARQAFISCNCNLLAGMQLPVSAPVFNVIVPSVIGASVSVLSSSVIQLTANFVGSSSIVPSNCVCIVSASPNCSAGINYPKNFFQPIQVLTELTNIDSLNFFSVYSILYGAPVVGQKIFFRLRVVSALSGQASKSITISRVVA